MSVLPKIGNRPKATSPWSVRRRRNPEEELYRLQHRFRAISRRHDRAVWLRSLYHRAQTPALALLATLALALVLLSLSPWPPVVTLKHVASAPNCDAARAMGLAPAIKGEPGYWPQHDRDKDGVACEPVPRWKRLF